MWPRKKKRRWDSFVTGGSRATVKLDNIQNSAKNQNISAKNLVASARSFRLK